MKENQRVTITKRMLKEGLLRLLDTKNLDKIRVNELCEESGINRATFYRHYETPHDVLLELQRDFIRQAAPISKRPQNVIEARKMLEHTCSYFYDHADVAKILFRCSNDEDMIRGLNEFYQHFMELQKTEQLFAQMDEATAKIITAFMGGGGYCLLRQWILEDIPKSPKEIADILYSITCWSKEAEMSNFLSRK